MNIVVMSNRSPFLTSDYHRRQQRRQSELVAAARVYREQHGPPPPTTDEIAELLKIPAADVKRGGEILKKLAAEATDGAV